MTPAIMADPGLGEALLLEGPAGRIEALLKRAPGARAAALVCHPHPRYGGTMYDKVVSRLARALHRAGISVLRFNFRGVGGSDGAFDEGRGEREDARAMLEFLAREHDVLLAAGFSFGAWVALAAGATDHRVQRMIGLGLPIDVFDFSFLRGSDKPLLVVQSDRDSWGALDKVQALWDGLAAPRRLEVLSGTNHFFEGRLDEMTDAVSRFLRDTAP
jgi:hypothetical protein